jgi:pimeloyl-ACP methyl ester carboxylesterase
MRAAVGIGAAALAAMAAFNTYAARRAARNHPPKGRFVDVDGIRLHYLAKGNGPPVVLLHGNVVTAEDYIYSGIFDRAAENHHVVAFDRPGMGYSDRPHGTIWSPRAQADLLRRGFARLGIERPIVVGHSWGAMVAAALALDHPEAVRGLVLLSGYYYPTARTDVVLSLPPAIPILGDILRHTVSPLMGRALLPMTIKAMFSPQAVPARFQECFPPGLSVRPSQIRASTQDGAMMTLAAAAVKSRYRELTMPVVIMAGTKDKVVDTGRQSRRLHQDIPQSSLRLIPDAGHMVHYAAPDEVAAAIDAVAAQGGGSMHQGTHAEHLVKKAPQDAASSLPK